MACSPPGSSIHGISQVYWSGLPCPPPGDHQQLDMTEWQHARMQPDCSFCPSQDGMFSLSFFSWLHQVLVAICKIFGCGMQTLSCSMWDLVPWPGVEPGPPALRAWSLNSWITREVPKVSLCINSGYLFCWCPDDEELGGSIHIRSLLSVRNDSPSGWAHDLSVNRCPSGGELPSRVAHESPVWEKEKLFLH